MHPRLITTDVFTATLVQRNSLESISLKDNKILSFTTIMPKVGKSYTLVLGEIIKGGISPENNKGIKLNKDYTWKLVRDADDNPMLIAILPKGNHVEMDCSS